MTVAATTLGSVGFALCTVMTFPPKLIASLFVYQDWLPFLADKPLRGWRDLVAGQLHTGEVRTAEVFAGRMGADPRAFAALVESPNEMRRRVFSRLPRERLDRYRADGLALCLQLIEAYWEVTL